MAQTTKMKASKPSKVVKPKKSNKYSTPHTRNHRFQPFSERISKLKIDPIRRRTNAHKDEELSEETGTYFGRSLEEWRDLNLSKTFTSFAKEVAPYSDSLAMVLHNQEKIMDLLVAYISQGDALAMEPLMSLMSHFAHDLDARFEQFFERAVITITAIAAKHQDPAVVEWSFTCLAWLFKYLSRLLAPDLRPLYNLMSPYLGKEAQKPFVVRFAAESMSFLIRKAAAMYERDPAALDNIIEHIMDDCVASEDLKSADFHRQGVMTLFTEATKSVQGGIHSVGPVIIRSLLKSASRQNGRQIRMQILVGILTSLIHHTSATSFEPIQEAVVSELRALNDAAFFSATVLLTIISVRKGTRISDWTVVVSVIQALTEGLDDTVPPETAHAILALLAAAIRYATIDAVLPLVSDLDRIRQGPLAEYFLQFCDLVSRLGSERFTTFVLPQLKKYAVSQWPNKRASIAAFLPHLASRHIEVKLNISQQQQNELITSISTASAQSLAEANLALSTVPHLSLGKSQRQALFDALVTQVESALQQTGSRSVEFQQFALGPCLSFLLKDFETEKPLSGQWDALCDKSSQMSALPTFWTSLVAYLDIHRSTDLDSSSTDALEEQLVRNLSLPSHELRMASLDILQRFYIMRKQSVPEILMAAISVESSPIGIETLRSMSMNIRRMALKYSDYASDELVLKAIPTFCFGVLHIKLSQLWTDACESLAEISKTSVGEEVIVKLAQAWLESTPDTTSEDPESSTAIIDETTDGFKIVSDFECSNLALVTAMAEQVFEAPMSGYASPEEKLRHVLKPVPSIVSNAREQALKVLHKIPQVAEKRSRMLVPVLLHWAGADQAADEDADLTSHRWSRKDQKAMLAIFAQFFNPRVLFKSTEVYAALLNLCANGDVEIQRAALKTIFAWKDAAVNRYSEHLLNLLDEERFREELSVFLQGNDEDSVRPEDHAVLMPVLLRLLYGRAIAGGKHGPGARRKAIFVALSMFDSEVLGIFIDIALSKVSGPAGHANVPLRQQLGVLNMLDDLLGTIGPDLEPFANQIMGAVLRCTCQASEKIELHSGEDNFIDGSMYRSIRQIGMQCLVKIYTAFENTDLSAAASTIKDTLISPRLSKFAVENTQSISGSLRLMSTWSSSTTTATYLEDEHILPEVASLLSQPSAKDEVRFFVMRDLLANLVNPEMPTSILEPHVSTFVSSIGSNISRQGSKDVLDSSVDVLVHLADRITNVDQAEAVVEVCTGLLTKPNKAVSPFTKTGLLRTLLPLVDKFNVKAKGPLFNAVCGLCSRLSDPQSRRIMSDVLLRLTKNDPEVSLAAEICADLNAEGAGLDEADHDRRSRGFTSIYEQAATLTPQQWLPIVHNCMFYIRDADDMVNRTSASQALLRFADAANERGSDFEPLVVDVVLPGIEFGVRDASELVRSEYVQLLGRLAEGQTWSAISDLTPLTIDGDDEASVFSNILHIQQHRRLRALRRLTELGSGVSSNNVNRFFLPLLEHFVFDQAEGDAGRTLADQTVITVGVLAQSLNWAVFRATFKRYVGYMTSKEDMEKTVLRLLGVLVDALSIPPTDDKAYEQKTNIIVRDFLPALMGYLHHKDESTVDRRMPVALTIVKLLLVLPEKELTARLPQVVTDIAHVLRSRSQEARDQARRTLSSILVLVGPAYLGFILKELRSVLSRGYQLHVLSFTIHTLLLKITESCEPGDLDHCLPELMSVIMDDIFGATGQEKDAEEYKSSMKEVKSSKSFDTMEILSRVTPIARLGLLVKPLRSLLAEKLDSRMLKKADELLLRLRKGVDQNPQADSRDMLAFCHEIVRQVRAEQNASSTPITVRDHKVRKYVLQMESANKSKSRAATSSHMFKLIIFGLDLVRRVVRRHDDLQTPANMAGFLPMAGDALVQGEEEIKLAAVRLLATIIRVPLPELETNAPVYLKEAVAMMKASTSTTTDSSKAALELVTAILREKRSVKIRETDIATMLKILKTDIDEPDRQGIIYRFLRAVLGRKIVITEVYEIMDEVGKVMVTNADRTVRESARSAYLQFIMDYPQGKDRWNKQAGFLVENLKYKHASGRQSVMELLHQLLAKIGDEIFAQLAFTMFVALVPVQISDPDNACRQMGGLLLAKLFERAEGEQLKSFVSLMDKWLDNEKKPMIQVASLKCWSIYLTNKDVSKKQSNGLRDRIVGMLESEDVVVGPQLLAGILELLSTMVERAPGTAFAGESEELWSTVHQCLAAADANVQETASILTGTYLSHLASSTAKSDGGLASLPLRGAHGLTLDGDGLRQLCRISLRVLLNASNETPEALTTQTVRNLSFLGRCFIANHLTWKSSSEDEETAANDEEETLSRDPSALAFLLNRLTHILRQDTLPAPIRSASIQCQSTIIPHLPSASIPNIQSLIRPLYTLTDPAVPTPTTDALKSLVDQARELMEVVQKKVGPDTFVRVLGQVRAEAKKTRDERRRKRKIEAVAAPEKWAESKRRKHEAARARKKEVGAEMRGRRRGW